jgi:hypothetical protein
MKLTEFHRAVLDLTEDQLSRLDPADPTPSAIGWSTAETIEHLVAVNAMCANAARQIGPELLGTPTGVALRQPGESPVDAWRRTAEEFSAAFGPENFDVPMPTPLGRPYPGSVVLTQGTLENLLHICDLGPLARIPDAIVGEALARVLERPDLWSEFRERGMYAEPVVADPDADPLPRLLGYTGRRPA